MAEAARLLDLDWTWRPSLFPGCRGGWRRPMVAWEMQVDGKPVHRFDVGDLDGYVLAIRIHKEYIDIQTSRFTIAEKVRRG